MKASVKLAIFVVFCECLAAVSAHSWLDCVNVTNPLTVTSLANLQCNYWPRTYVGRSNPDANMWKVEGMSQAQFNTYPACRNSGPQYTAQYPKGRSMYPGETMTIAYTPNGHTTWMKPNPPPRGPQNFYIKWTGTPGTQLNTMADVVNAQSILTVQFDQPCHSRTTGAQLDPSSGICQADVKIPAGTAPGTYQLVWYWPFRFASPTVIEDYTTCWDVTVLPAAGSSSASSSSSAATATVSSSSSGSSSSSSGTSDTGSSSSSSSGSGTSGTPVNMGSDLVILARAPTQITGNTDFNVTVAYVASLPRDIVVDILDSVTYTWYGKGITNVPAGKGSVTLTIHGQNSPPMGTNYQFKAWNVARGVAGTDGDWTHAIDLDYRQVTVGSSVVYSDCSSSY